MKKKNMFNQKFFLALFNKKKCQNPKLSFYYFTIESRSTF